MIQYQEKGEIIVYNLVCRAVFDSHTAVNIKLWLAEILNQFEIEDKQILVIAIDSAANIQKAAKCFLEDLAVNPFLLEIPCFSEDEDGSVEENEEEDTDFESDPCVETICEFEDDQTEEPMTNLPRLNDEPEPQIINIPSSYKIPCVAHQLQLAVNKFGEQKNIKKMVETARSLSSKLRNQNIRRLLRNENYPIAILDQPTRWMSTWKMLERLEKLEVFCKSNQTLFKGDVLHVLKFFKPQILNFF